MKMLISCFRKIFRYIREAPGVWGEASHIEAMMESRRKVRQKMEGRKLWEDRYREIAKKHERPPE